MTYKDFTMVDRLIGKTTALALFYLGIVYTLITIIGLLSLKSKLEQIGDPWFSIMEILILVMVPLMVMLMCVVYAYASHYAKTYSLTALVFMSILACITSSVHFIRLTVYNQIGAIKDLPWIPIFFSFEWPSVIYALDILAWDLFFGLSMVFAAQVFKGDKLRNSIRILMTVSGVLCFIGLIGPIVGNMQIRNIGIVGYGILFPIVCLLLAKVFGQIEFNEQEGKD